MRADDDGFIGNPKRLLRMLGCDDDDLRILIAKGYIITFDDGVIVIRDWLLNNQIRSDRYKPTIYTTNKSKLRQYTNKQYFIINGNQLATEGNPRLDKISKVKLSTIYKDSTNIDQQVSTVDKSTIAEVFAHLSPDSPSYKTLKIKYGGN